ncbi:hypothetical protein K3495_g2189 [Podosphaera aphanis]|nr:hypothetical protein K3495_g2189 [Podosphaera aphanis]
MQRLIGTAPKDTSLSPSRISTGPLQARCEPPLIRTVPPARHVVQDTAAAAAAPTRKQLGRAVHAFPPSCDDAVTRRIRERAAQSEVLRRRQALSSWARCRRSRAGGMILITIEP